MFLIDEISAYKEFDKKTEETISKLAHKNLSKLDFQKLALESIRYNLVNNRIVLEELKYHIDYFIVILPIFLLMIFNPIIDIVKLFSRGIIELYDWYVLFGLIIPLVFVLDSFYEVFKRVHYYIKYKYILFIAKGDIDKETAIDVIAYLLFQKVKKIKSLFHLNMITLASASVLIINFVVHDLVIFMKVSSIGLGSLILGIYILLTYFKLHALFYNWYGLYTLKEPYIFEYINTYTKWYTYKIHQKNGEQV